MGIHLLSKPQKLIYDLERFAGGSVSNITASVLFEGRLDMTSMEKAVNLVLKNNDAFRIQIFPEGTQQITEHTDEIFTAKHFSTVQDFHDWAAEEALLPLELGGKLYKITVININDESFGTLVTFHHLISDAWSAALYASRLYKYYTALKNNEEPLVKSYSYLDFLENEKKYIDSESFLKDKEYWKNEFRNFDEPVFLSEKSSVSLQSRRVDFTLSKEVTAKIRDFACRHQISVFGTMLSVFSIYMARIKEAESFQIGTTMLNRSNRAEKNTMGMFVNTLALPIKIEIDESFANNAVRISKNLLPALRHQRYNHNDVLRDIQESHGYTGKLYDVLINYQNAQVAGMDDNFLATYWYHCGMQPEALQIQINDRDNFGELYISYDYQVEKFSEKEIKQVHERLLCILQSGIDNEDSKISKLEVMSKDEKNWLVNTLNESGHELPKTLCIHKFFEHQVKQNPDNIAQLYDKSPLSYCDLNRQAEQVVDFLRSKNIVRGQVVALLMERCAEMMPIILGALKAGCAYMPLGTGLPKDRVDYILENSKAALIFYQEQFIDRFNQNIPSLEVTSIHSLPAPLMNTASENNPNEVAYILYTSGSTGRPKGVQIEHHSVCNRLLWMHDKYPLAQQETLIQKTNYAFDVSVWELFWAFMTGRTLLVPPAGVERDPERLIQYIKDEDVKKIHFVPSMLSVFLDYMEAAKVKIPQLRKVIVSGEALTPALNKRFYSLFADTGATLHNLYGPTECTVDVLYYDCKPDDEEIPIGKPVWNTSAFILSKDLQLMPQGVEGELAISGVQLARGYVDPALDERRFIEKTPFGKIYMTGDKAMVREDGEILYLGRNDDQIKIRGQRVEIPEIEEILLGFSNISQVNILFDSEQLIAFYKSDEGYTKKDFEDFLADKLPSYMIPYRYIQVADFPLNANGKLDRKKLLELAKNSPDSSSNSEKGQAEAVTEQERQILAVVSKHLGQKISVNDNLLQSGLSSLQIISVIAELSSLGTQLKVNDFYTLENVRALADNSAIHNRPLLHVYNASSSDLAIICVPYGGGSFGSFASLAAKLKTKADLPVIAAQSAHVSPENFLDALHNLPYRRFIVLGCCVGSGLAIDLAKRIEAKPDYGLKSVYLISSTPPFGVRLYGKFFNPWKISSPAIINKYLQGLSEKEFRLGEHEIDEFRADVSFFLKYLAVNRHSEIKAPVKLIYGSIDPMINEKKVASMWGKHFGKQVDVTKIPNAKHYIVHTHIDEVIEPILSDI